MVQTKINKTLSSPQPSQWLSPVFVKYSSLFIDLLKRVIFSNPTKGCYKKGGGWNELPRNKSMFSCKDGCGLPIGNLTSQLFSNVYLSLLDDFVKRDLGFKHYGRYVDDFYIIDCSKDKLLKAIPAINDFLKSKLRLSLHPRKIYLQEAKRGVRFLGSYVTPYYTKVDKRSYNRSLVLWYETISTMENPYQMEAVKASVSALDQS